MINIKSDSRKIKKGDIFVALDGIKSNGSDYIDQAIKNGARKIVCKSGKYSVETLEVENPRKYLNEYLVNHYNKYLDEMTIIGITGTNGKTTSSHLIYQALNQLGMKCAYIGTIGYYLDKKVLDLPNTSVDVCDLYELIINAYDKGYKYLVMEVSSQGLAYQRLEGIKFDYAIFTNLTEDHLDYHKTMENYCLAKQKLFKMLKPNGVGIVNSDDDYSNYFKIGHYLTYGFNDSNYQVTNYKLSNESTNFNINNLFNIHSPLIGKYNIYNVLCVVIILDLLKIDKFIIEKVIANLKTPNGRMEKIKYQTNSIIVDYAHTPDAMINVYNTVKEIPHHKIITVFGCTGDRDRLKRPIMLDLATTNSDYSIITMDDLHDEDFNHIVKDMTNGITKTNYEVIMDRGRAIDKGISLLNNNDILLILGKGHETGIIIKDKKIPFNDAEYVLKVINKVSV